MAITKTTGVSTFSQTKNLPKTPPNIYKSTSVMPINTKSATDKHCSKCKLSSNAKNTIKCPGCHKFIHSKCAGLNHEEFTLFSKCNRHFRCNECLNLFNTLLSNNMFINKLDTTDDELPSNNITPPKSDSNIELILMGPLCQT